MNGKYQFVVELEDGTRFSQEGTVEAGKACYRLEQIGYDIGNDVDNHKYEIDAKAREALKLTPEQLAEVNRKWMRDPKMTIDEIFAASASRAIGK